MVLRPSRRSKSRVSPDRRNPATGRGASMGKGSVQIARSGPKRASAQAAPRVGANASPAVSPARAKPDRILVSSAASPPKRCATPVVSRMMPSLPSGVLNGPHCRAQKASRASLSASRSGSAGSRRMLGQMARISTARAPIRAPASSAVRFAAWMTGPCGPGAASASGRSSGHASPRRAARISQLSIARRGREIETIRPPVMAHDPGRGRLAACPKQLGQPARIAGRL